MKDPLSILQLGRMTNLYNFLIVAQTNTWVGHSKCTNEDTSLSIEREFLVTSSILIPFSGYLLGCNSHSVFIKPMENKIGSL